MVGWNLQVVDTFGTSHFVLYKEVKCKKEPQSVSFIESFCNVSLTIIRGSTLY